MLKCRQCGLRDSWSTNGDCAVCFTRSHKGDGTVRELWNEWPEYDPKLNKRAAILDTAKGYVTKDRQATHGEPEDSFGMIARLWSAYLGQEVSAIDVSMMMTLMKVARIKGNPKHIDSYVDICGYAACGGEIAGNEHG